MKFTLAASLALVGAVAAQDAATPATGCAATFDTCRTTTKNQAQCASDKNGCQVTCYDAYNTCRTTRQNGMSANMSKCASDYSVCVGENPFSPDGSLTLIPTGPTPAATTSAAAAAATTVAAGAAPTGAPAADCDAKFYACRSTPVGGASANQAQCAAENAACKHACEDTYYACRSTRVDGRSANQAQCAAQYAGCLGTNPFSGNGTNTAGSAMPTGVSAGNGTTNGTSTGMPAVFTGAAAQVGAGFGLLGAAVVLLL